MKLSLKLLLVTIVEVIPLNIYSIHTIYTSFVMDVIYPYIYGVVDTAACVQRAVTAPLQRFQNHKFNLFYGCFQDIVSLKDTCVKVSASSNFDLKFICLEKFNNDIFQIPTVQDTCRYPYTQIWITYNVQRIRILLLQYYLNTDRYIIVSGNFLKYVAYNDFIKKVNSQKFRRLEISHLVGGVNGICGIRTCLRECIRIACMQSMMV
eukprot:TRINITY_DN6456_c0_g2_i6.p2 TRINITY_DN6456_c0_g2~~TRINITY_DN6456_c0_g2_i6.p2  ORF type:complete len:207 (-),score=-0.73 TRINITY_DN6456_c0_g2_i6:123-743(-)